jgi:hypothetical protein
MAESVITYLLSNPKVTSLTFRIEFILLAIASQMQRKSPKRKVLIVALTVK